MKLFVGRSNEMLVGSIGAPGSGKTTTAARLFAELKESANSCEFITERARTLIAFKHFQSILTNLPFALSDGDQYEIANSQYTAELIMKTVCGPNSIVITDSCVLNSLLYMSDDFRTTPQVTELIEKSIKQYDLLFLCHLVPRLNLHDPNRIHSEEESVALHDKLELLVKQYCPNTPVVQLMGNPRSRLLQAVATTLDTRDTLL